MSLCPWCNNNDRCQCSTPKPAAAEQTLTDCQPHTRATTTTWLVDLPGCLTHATATITWWRSEGRNEWTITARRRTTNIVQAGGRRGMIQRHQPADHWPESDPRTPTWARELLATTKTKAGQ